MPQRLLRPQIFLLPVALALAVGAQLAARPLTRQTPTTLVLPIPGTGGGAG